VETGDGTVVVACVIPAQEHALLKRTGIGVVLPLQAAEAKTGTAVDVTVVGDPVPEGKLAGVGRVCERVEKR